MDRSVLEKLLADVAAGRVDVGAAMETLKRFPEDASLGYATLDTHRALRQGHPEIVLGERKSAVQIVGIVRALLTHGHPILITRVDAEKAAAVMQELPLKYHSDARALVGNEDKIVRAKGKIAVVSAGTSDHPVAEEAVITAEVLGLQVERFYDIGVAGLHRLLGRVEKIREAGVVIVVAGMEGALPSVVGGLIDKPVIAVPTSVGYGAAVGGFAALLGMLSSCASGLTVVNIDNGFGAAYAAFRIMNVHAAAD
jgi:NCAIR mutase (PurE)-related protein